MIPWVIDVCSLLQLSHRLPSARVNERERDGESREKRRKLTGSSRKDG